MSRRDRAGVKDCISKIGHFRGFANDYDRAHYVDGLRLAGMPEG
jgi:hypothetical protein